MKGLFLTLCLCVCQCEVVGMHLNLGACGRGQQHWIPPLELVVQAVVSRPAWVRGLSLGLELFWKSSAGSDLSLPSGCQETIFFTSRIRK